MYRDSSHSSHCIWDCCKPNRHALKNILLPSCSQGIYFAAKSGRMCAEAIVEASQGGKKMCGEDAIRVYLDK